MLRIVRHHGLERERLGLDHEGLAVGQGQRAARRAGAQQGRHRDVGQRTPRRDAGGGEAALDRERGAERGLGGREDLEVGGAQTPERVDPFLRRRAPGFVGGGADLDHPRAVVVETHAQAGELGERGRGGGGAGLLGSGQGAQPWRELAFEGAFPVGAQGDGRQMGGAGEGGGLLGVATVARAGLDRGDPREAGGVGVAALHGDGAGATRAPVAAGVEQGGGLGRVAVGHLALEVVVGVAPHAEHGAGLEGVATALALRGLKLVQPRPQRVDRLGRANAAHDRGSGTGRRHSG